MSIKDRYKISQATWQAMIKDGVLSCSVATKEEILERVNTKKSAGVTQTEAIKITSIEMNISERWIYTVLAKYS
jgi:hypothetical protein